MINRLPLSDDQRGLLTQLLRYGITGGFVTLLGVAAYAAAVRFGQIAPLIANVIAYLISMGFGYVMHGRYSFRGHA
jgi:putative flippase GtrA